MANNQQLSVLNWGGRGNLASPVQRPYWNTQENRRLVLGFPSFPAGYVRQTLLEVIKNNLSRIRTADGYNNDLLEICTEPKSIEAFSQFPAANLFIDTKHKITLVGDGPVHNLIHHDTVLTVDVFLQSNDPMTDQEAILADVQYVFGNYYWLPDSSGRPMASNMTYSSSETFGIKSTIPTCGISITYIIDRHFLSGNPYAAA